VDGLEVNVELILRDTDDPRLPYGSLDGAPVQRRRDGEVSGASSAPQK
jgi:hypothetical protein